MADDLFPEDDDAPFAEEVTTLIPPDETTDQGSRWVRLTLLKRTTPIDHPWCKLFLEHVTGPVLYANRTGHRWNIRDPLALLILMEDLAIEHGLMEPSEAPRFTPRQCIGEFGKAIRLKPVAVPLIREPAVA